MNAGLRYVLVRLLSIFFGVVLIVAALDKLIDPYAFALSIENYRVVGKGLSMLAALWLPAFELLLGLLLLTGIWPRSATLLNCGLFFVFLILVVQAYARGLDIECGCFGSHSGTIGPLKLLENLLFAGSAVFLFRQAAKPGKLTKETNQ